MTGESGEQYILDEDAGPNLRRRHLGRQLRLLRQQRGRSLKDVAKWTGLQDGTISKIENGKQAILPRNVRILCQYYDVGAPQADLLVRLAEESNQRGWWDFYSDTMPDWFEQFVGLESDAEELWNYAPAMIDGLLQTADYAMAFLRQAWPEPTEREVHQSVELRQARQGRLNRDKHPTRLQCVLDEAALHRLVGSTEVMREQLHHLIKISAKPNITLHVMPFSAGAHAGSKSAFSLLRFPETLEMDAVYIENERGAVWLERPADIEHYTGVFDLMRSRALSPDASVELVDSLASSL